MLTVCHVTMSNLLVDTREPMSLKLKLAAAKLEHDLIMLPCGDFVITDREGIASAYERKTIADFLASIPERIDDQLSRCAKSYRHVSLILEGAWKVDKDGMVRTERRKTGWRAEAFWAKLGAVQARYGVTLWPTPDQAGTVRLLDLLCRTAATRGL